MDASLAVIKDGIQHNSGLSLFGMEGWIPSGPLSVEVLNAEILRSSSKTTSMISAGLTFTARAVALGNRVYLAYGRGNHGLLKDDTNGLQGD